MTSTWSHYNTIEIRHEHTKTGEGEEVEQKQEAKKGPRRCGKWQLNCMWFGGSSTPWEAIRSPQQVEAGRWCWWLAGPHCSCGSSRRMCWRCSGSAASWGCCSTGTLSKQKEGVGERRVNKRICRSIFCHNNKKNGAGQSWASIYILVFACWAADVNGITGTNYYVGYSSPKWPLQCGQHWIITITRILTVWLNGSRAGFVDLAEAEPMIRK